MTILPGGAKSSLSGCVTKKKSPPISADSSKYDRASQRILDKISRGGMSSLTDEERQRLEEASRKFRSN